MDPTECLRDYPISTIESMDTATANGLIELIRWGGKVRCSCGRRADAMGETGMGWISYRCRACRAKFTARTGTCWNHFQKTPQEWLRNVCVIRYRFPGAGPWQLQDKAGLPQSATLMLHQYRSEYAAGMRPEIGTAPKIDRDDLTQARVEVAKVLIERGTRLRQSEVFALAGDSPAHKLAYGDLANLTRAQIEAKYPQAAPKTGEKFNRSEES